MNRYLPLVLIALGILAFATLMLVIAPGVQIAQHAVPKGLSPYSEQESRGREQYVSLGCVYCHSQQPRSPDQAPDVERGWGRPSVAGDYVFDQPHQLGTMRTGPDLLNVGVRLPSESWHLTHLYQPRAIFGWSIMPAYPYLFEEKPEAGPEDTVVVLPKGFGPESGVVVARQEALDLTAYLLALDRTYPVPEDALRDDGYADRESGS
ncbi:cbb3-type cytochrome c oxidase subunit II [Paracoccus thiocyanatus]|uniref:Cytochrome-c oxidase n=1 Tax=Paracoccus thiocyanatus TaxID=34006 RepID=A0A3D8PD96_9RHOB|nr:cbb3-type cytochrome c oxidase subunit II [Paracoccus thiocyanatus]RDW14040.1 cytochrome-c oxidase [Paracoccus thiocyanatus]